MHLYEREVGLSQFFRAYLLQEKYLLEKIPSPVRIKAVKSANEPTSPELSPPPSPKRKREVEFSRDLKDVAFTAVLPPKNVDLARSQSTF